MAVSVFVTLPETIIYLFFDNDPIFIIGSIVTLLVFVGILYVLIFKPDLIIDLFILGKGFDSENINENKFSWIHHWFS